eukprot:gnl/Spiro4/4552_TR2269_c0_g1_i1.p2 gnl/Spiro4/4552_TR2269_c0_g1~~gnl/Spiro4/4552_TR2269_c0_g1_i1.p2  ORF type:complete len:115 (-),score=18.68 gnl/Spiro4/4552_TR2269_c0_g1_i1:172-486(-)
MPCEACQKKLTRIVTPDPWKAGSRNTNETGRSIGVNALIDRRRQRRPAGPLGVRPCKCQECKQPLNPHADQHHILCQTCAYKSGLCSMCGKKILDISGYRQSVV